ncbi:hypothetical protein CHS0354_009320 [Potamilus streckersoni]|uniref:Uncharacterized protein n=1 Tax=Potamilus streckersoni TaxID=2493646 RepID=A0AAE0SN10_9BIVA|nr:hypothetical protein CHS0354_009320 [Potamilus streckersoni]
MKKTGILKETTEVNNLRQARENMVDIFTLPDADMEPKEECALPASACRNKTGIRIQNTEKNIANTMATSDDHRKAKTKGRGKKNANNKIKNREKKKNDDQSKPNTKYPKPEDEKYNETKEPKSETVIERFNT